MYWINLLDSNYLDYWQDGFEYSNEPFFSDDIFVGCEKENEEDMFEWIGFGYY